MRRKLSKLMAYLLTFCMLMSLMPATAFAIPATHSHAICGAAHTDIGDHTGSCEDITWTAWDGTTAFPGGNVYLSNDITLEETLEISSGTVNLCLNGKVLSIDKDAFIRTVIEVSADATLNICDCRTTEHKFIPDESGLWVLDEENGTKSVYGGVITGGSANVGSAINSNGTLRIYGGNIVGNHGGSRAVVYSSGAEFSMYGGSICGNTGGEWNVGVGLCLYNDNGKHQIRGGKIYENKAVTYDSPEGVGVYVYGGNLTISDAVEIYGNKRGTEDDNIYMPWNLNQECIIIDGELTNTTPIGVWAGYEDVVIKADGTNVTDLTEYMDNFTPDNTGRVLQLSVDKKNIKLLSPHSHAICGGAHSDIGDHTGNCEDITWTAVSTEADLKSMTSGGSYYLANDIELTSGLAVPSINICLNGFKLKQTAAAAAMTANGGVTLNICDCSGEQTGTIIGGYNNNGSGIFCSGYSAPTVLNVYGCKITGCTEGAAIGLEYDTTANLYDCTITGNNGSYGGVYSWFGPKLNLYGGEITGNTATYGGGGIWLYRSTLNVSGDVKISGNTLNGSPNNLHIEVNESDPAVVSIGEMADNSDIGVTIGKAGYREVSPGEYEQYVEFLTGTISANGASYIDNFFSDVDEYMLATDGEGLKLVEKPTTYAVAFNANGGNGTMLNQTIEVGTETALSPNSFTQSGYKFSGWATSADGAKVYDDKQSVTDLANAGESITLFAVWTEKATITISDVQQQYYYTGEPIEFNLNSPLTGFTVKYRVKDTTTWSDSIPTEVNIYDVKITRAEDADYKAYEMTFFGKLVINKALQSAPAAPAVVNETIKNKKDGKITGVTSDMEYQKQGDADYTEISGTSLEGLEADTYLVRYKETETHSAGEDKELVIADGKTISAAFDMGGHGTSVDLQSGKAYGDTVTEPAAPADNEWKFIGWYKENTFTDEWDFANDTLSDDTTIYAKWEEKKSVAIDEDAQTYYYDGSEKGFVLSGTDAGLTGFDIQYKIDGTYGSTKPTEFGSYDVKITREYDNEYKAYSKEITRGLVIAQSGTEFTDKQILKDGTPTTTFTYGDTITVKIKPQATGQAAPMMLMSLSAPAKNQMALFYNNGTEDIQISDAAEADSDGYYTMTVNTTENLVKPTNATVSLIAKYVGNNNMADYSETLEITFNKADSSVTAPAPVENLVYNGSEQTLISAATDVVGGTVKYKLEGGEYSTELPQATNAGTYTVYYKVFGDDYHNDTAENSVSVTIAKAQIAKPSADNRTFTYTGSEQTYIVTENDKYTVSGNKRTNAGTQNVTVALKDKNNYEWADRTTDDLTFTFNIGRADAEITINGDTSIVKTYGDIWELPTASSTFGTVRTNKTVENLKNAGTYTVTYSVIETENYNRDTKTVSVTVNPLPVNITWENTESLVYDGNEKTINPIVANKVSGDTFNFAFDGTSTLTATEKGTYTATVTDVGNANYTLTGGINLTKTWAIAEAANEWTTPLSITGWIYGGTANEPTAAAKFGTPVYTYANSVDGAYTSDVPASVGTWYVKATVAGATSYAEISDTKEFVITEKELNADSITAIGDVTFTGEEIKPAVEVRDGNTILVLGTDYEVAYQDNTNAGTAKVIITFKGNYKGTPEKSFIILPKKINPTITLAAPASNETPVTSIETEEYTATVVWSPTVTDKFAYSTEYTATVTITPKANYTVTGITENEYTIEGATVTNAADSGNITAVFAKTGSRPSSGGGVSKYTVKFETNGGTTVANKSVTRNVLLAEPTAPTKDGYTFDGWYTDKELATAYDFDTKVTKSFTLYAKWTEIEKEPEDTDVHNCPSKEFTDLDVTAWYHLDTDYAIENGIFKGTTETTFEPDSAQTRAMMVTVLYRVEGEPAVNRSIPFADVDRGAYYANAVIWGQQNGIIKGYSETEFGPDDKITREQIAAIMHRYAQYKGYDVSVGENTNILSYDDFDSISEYAIASMQWACDSSLMKGKTATTLNPLDNATRAEIAAILHRFLEANK